MTDKNDNPSAPDEAWRDDELAAAWRSGGGEPMPESLRRRVERDADAFFADDAPATAGRIGAWSGWVAAAVAAGLLLAVLLWPTSEDRPSFAAFLAETGGTPVALSGSGAAEVAWDDGRQMGLLRVRDLPVNDPAEARYQLWIIDATRPADDGRNRVDGGLFDVEDAGGWTEIEIDAKLPIGAAAGFAVTREPPGGSVVSELGDRLLLISPSVEQVEP